MGGQKLGPPHGVGSIKHQCLREKPMNTTISEKTAPSPLSTENRPAEMVSDQLNSHCFCVSLNHDALREALTSEMGSPELLALVEERCPYLFSARPVFISDSQTERMEKVVHAIESVLTLPTYRKYVLDNAPAIARHDPGGAKGVFFGYDFHLRGDCIGLIEINTNAGGAMLNAVMARAHHACCLDREQTAVAAASAEILEQNIVDMFLSEWKLSGRCRPLQTIAIVDTAPQQQYLYPEFLLFQRLFERHGLCAVIADPSELMLRDGILWHDEIAVDLVYNRLTDFMLESPASEALRAAYLEHAIVLTPHPQAHALFANKRNLALLSDVSRLQALGVSQPVQEILLENILHTEVVDVADGDRLWSERRQLFFKPTASFGARAAYRGDKLTKRVWQDILAGEYVAQALMAPGERVTGIQENPELLKFDLRIYTYDGTVQWTAARLYQGQTTNFRTPGGGFAPVYSLPDAAIEKEMEAILKPPGNTDTMSCCQKNCT
jgi:hypothetical protein